MNNSASATMVNGSDSTPVTRLHAVIRGKVQNVGFRYWAHHTAHQLELTGGHVRNMADGTVEVEAEASERAVLEKLFHELHVGPTAAQVVAVDAIWEENVAPRHLGEFQVA